MNKLYKILVVLLSLTISSKVSAQKTLKLEVYQLTNTPGTDCDPGTFEGDSDWEWIITSPSFSQLCVEIDNNNANTDGTVRNLWGSPNTYYSRDCWPPGSMSTTFRGQEDDGASNCDSEGGPTHTQNLNYPAYNAAAGNINNTVHTVSPSSSTFECPIATTFTMSTRWVVGGSDFNAVNLTNGYVNNATCATAIPLGTNTFGTLRSNDATQCTDTWYSYVNTGTLNSIVFDPSQNGCTVEVYYSATNDCNASCLVASGGGVATLTSPRTTGTYYIRLTSSSGANTNLVVTRNAGSSNDFIGNAIDISATINGGSTYNGSFTNDGWGTEYGEPQPNGIYNTAWYKFTTNATPPNSVSAYITQTGNSDNPASAIYRYNGGNCTFNHTQLAADYWYASSDGTITANCLAANTTYYFQFGTNDVFVDPGDNGTFNISISPGPPAGPNDICSAGPIGPITATNFSYNSGTYNNDCANMQSGEQSPHGLYNSIWHTFTTPALPGGWTAGEKYSYVRAQQYEVSSVDNTVVAMYKLTGACSIANVGSPFVSDYACVNSDIRIDGCVEYGNTYYIQTGTQDCPVIDPGETGNYRLEVSTPNFDFVRTKRCNALSLGTVNGPSGAATSTSNRQNNQCSDAGNAGDPAFFESSYDKDAWYSFTTPATVPAQYTIDMLQDPGGLGDDISCLVEVYLSSDGTCNGTLSSVGSNNPATGSAQVSVCLQPSKTYFIRAAGQTGLGMDPDGIFQIRITPGSITAGPNDICSAGPIGPITATNFSYNSGTYNNDCANMQAGEQSPHGLYNSIWHTFTTPALPGGWTAGEKYSYVRAQQYEVSSVDNTVVAMYKLTGACSIANVGSPFVSDYACVNSDIRIDGCVEYGNTYYIQTGTQDCPVIDPGETGNYRLEVSTPNFDFVRTKRCNALSLGTVNGPSGAATSTTNKQNNQCSDDGNAGDPAYFDSDFRKDAWYSFTTPATVPAQYTIDMLQDPGGLGDDISCLVEVYLSSDGTCNGTLSSVGSDNPISGSAQVKICPLPSKTYFIRAAGQVSSIGCPTCDPDGIFQIRVTPGSATAGPDNVCNATSIGTINGLTGTLNLNNHSNECATTQSGEFSGGQNTVWYTFTTGATVAKDFNITMDALTNGLNADIYVYRVCGTVCTAGVPTWTNLEQIDNFYNFTPGFGEYDASGTISGQIRPSTTYYIRADGTSTVGETGTFNINMSFSGGAYNGNDDFCNAWTAGTSNNPGGSGAIHNENGPNNDSLDLGETITIPTFNNKSASSQEDCAWDEPNNDEDDETVWIKFTTSATPGTEITIDADASNGTGGADCFLGSFAWVKAYIADNSPALPANCAAWTSTTNWFNGIIEAGKDDLIDASIYYIECPSPSTTYYIQVENTGAGCDMSDFTMTITDNGISKAPNDRICNATTLSTPTYTNPQTLVGTYTPHTLINQNNFCATNTGEPTPSCFGTNDQAVWYKLPAASAPGASDISNPGRKVVIVNARSNHAGGSEDEINLQLALYTNSNMASCPTNPTTGFTLTTDIQGDNCAYVSPLSIDPDQVFQLSEYLTSACLTPGTDYYLMVDGEVPFYDVLTEYLKEGWFEFDAYYPREIGDLPCSAVPFKLFGNSNGFNTGYDNASGAFGTGDATKTGLTDNLYNNSNLCTTYTPGTGANQEPGTTFTTGDGNDNPGWVYFYAPPSGSVRITATADPQDIMKDGTFDNIDLQLAIYQETTPGNCSIIQPPQSPVSSIVSYNILDGYGEVMYVNCLTPGRKYYLEIDASTSPITQTRGIFDLKIEDYQPNAYAPNDQMCDAIPFSDSYIATNTWNRINYKDTLYIADTKNWCADNLNEPGRPALGGYNETGVWYKFIAPPSGKIHILAENTDYGSLSKPSGDPNHIDLSLAIYKLNQGYSCTQYANPAATTLIAQDYQNPLVTSGAAIAGTSVEDEEMEVSCLIPGQEYYLLVSGKKSAGIGSDWDYGRFNLTITSDPRNPASWNGAYNTVSGNQYLPATLNPSIDTVCGAANLGTMPAGTAWFQPFTDRKVPSNCSSNFYMSPPFNNFCATATNDPTPGYQQSIVNAFGSNHQPVWFKFTTPSMGAYDPSIISVEIEAISGDCSTAIFDDWYDEGCSPSDEVYQDCIDLGVSLWMASNGTCSGPLYEMGSDYDPGFYDEDATIHCLDPNTTYYIMVDGSALNEEGNFNLRIQQVNPDPRPSNNFICNAKKLTTGAANSPASFWGGGVAFTYEDDTNICADTRLNVSSAAGTEPIPSGWDVVSPPSDAADMTHTVWYSFMTPVAAGDYAVHIDVNSDLPWPFGDLVNPKIAVWESQDGSCNYTHPNGTNMVEMASEYDPLAFWGESIDVYCLKPNTLYYVQVGGTLNVYGQEQGFFDIVINDIPPIAIPANDNVCNAFNVGTITNSGSVTISSTPGNKIGDASSGANNYHNYCTDLEAGEPVPSAFTPDNTVWFKFRTPNNAGKRFDVTINVNSDPAPDHNDGINLQLALYESSVLGSCAFANFTEIESDFDAILWDETLNASCLKPNTDYYVQVDGTKGFLELFRAQGFGYFGIEVVTSAYYDAPANDNICSATNLGTVPVAGNLSPATWYYNSCATLEANEPIDIPTELLSYDVDQSVWFKFVPGRDADFKISAISEGLLLDPIDLQVALFRPSSGLTPACPTMTELVQEAADYDALFFDEDLTAPCLRQGQTYYIQVDGSALNMTGRFQIKVEDMGASTVAPANDNFCSATLMTFTGGVASLTNQSNVCATIQASEPQTPASVQKSVWYKFQAPPSGRIRITTHDADGALRGLDPEFYVYENGAAFNCASFGNLTPNGSAYNPVLDIPIIAPNLGDESVENECFVPGWWYLIQVDGTTVGGPQGKFDIKIEDLLTPYTVVSGNKPANDDFATATTLTIQSEPCNEGGGRTELVGTGTWDPENYGKSTRDMINGLGSGACSVSELCGDLWYKFVVTSPVCNNGYSPMIIQGKAKSTLLEGSNLHVIAYKGTAGALTVLGCGEASASLSNSSYFNFEINEAVGTTVYLQVFGENADDWDENFELCVSQKRGFDYCAHAAASPPMMYGVDYCYNIKGATLESAASGYAESCPLTGIPGLPDPDSDAPTENSVYFKFVTDNTCSDYRLNFKYYFTGYSALSDKGISYTIYKDDTPCDGAAVGSGALDCQSFYNNNAGSFEYDILFRNNSYLATATGIDNNSTYYIQIDGPGNNFGNLDGTIKIEQVPVCLPIVIDSMSEVSMTQYYTCGDGWRHYFHTVGSQRKYKFSLFDNGNTSLQGIAKIYYATDHYTESIGCEYASHVMRRYWDYEITSGSIDPAKPVSIRFYYLPVEKQEIIDAMMSFQASGCLGTAEGFEWFKSCNGIAFDYAAHTNPYYVYACYGSGISTGAAFSLTTVDSVSCNNVTYVEYQGLTGFSGGTGATGNGYAPTPLPIELISFTGSYNEVNHTNDLQWATASEFNNDYFVVEKSLDGSIFVPIGTVDGAGNSNTVLNYTLIDPNPVIGNNYYRLVQYDFDGTSTTSPIINIKVADPIPYQATYIDRIYPNPTSGKLNVDIMVSVEQLSLNMSVTNVIGQHMRDEVLNLQKGKNTIVLDASAYAQGVYLINLMNKLKDINLNSKFVKQ